MILSKEFKYNDKNIQEHILQLCDWDAVVDKIEKIYKKVRRIHG